jgi:hypothetical protein
LVNLKKCDVCGRVVPEKQAFGYGLYKYGVDEPIEDADLCAGCATRLRRWHPPFKKERK